MTVAEVRRLIGYERVGRGAVYAVARKHGVRLGKRLLLPRRVVEDLLEGRLSLEPDEKTPQGVRG